MNEQILKDFKEHLKNRIRGTSLSTLSNLFSRIASLYKNSMEDEVEELFRVNFERFLTGGEEKAYSVARDVYNIWVAKLKEGQISKKDFVKLMGHGRKIVKILQSQKGKDKNQKPKGNQKQMNKSSKEFRKDRNFSNNKVSKNFIENPKWKNQLKKIKGNMGGMT